ncbi:MAG: hypothetical protein S4CHLAM2_04300 [Chlamydiales bacterium]|nr:hypothetical protein [Chlamydiales bacterium]
MTYQIPLLPLQIELETKQVLRKLTLARSALGELKGVANSVPNQAILINTLSLQEAKDSSAIENIITTHDELFKSDLSTQQFSSVAAKEVYNYVKALESGYKKVLKTGLLTSNDIISLHASIIENNAGFRKLPGTDLKNEQTGEIVYTPPQEEVKVIKLMNNLEQFINNNALDETDSLVKMAIIHHQFESIHPFYDGNGRAGRIINVLYLVKEGLLNIPVLYLSRYINQNKAEYYRLLQAVRMSQAWEEWVLFMLEGVAQTSLQTIQLVQSIKALMNHHKVKIREHLPKIYSQDLLNNLFRHPYTKIDFVTEELKVHRNTAGKYLDELVAVGVLFKHRIGKENFYINKDLFDLLSNWNSRLDNL